METYAKILNVAIIFFVGLIIVEYVASILLRRSVNRGLDTIASLSSGLTNIIKDVLGLTVVILSYSWMYDHLAVFQLEANIWMYLLGFILIDLSAYWSHRWNHEINLFWNRHLVHHSSEEFNLSCALRQSISGIVAIYFFLSIPMAFIGIPKEVIQILGPIHLFAQFWYHTRLIDRMGLLEHIIVTPSHHRVHHAINPEYIDKNYAAIFIVWDKWFGTFQEELPDVPPVYGVKRPVNTWNPIIINFMHLWQLIVDAWRTQDWRAKFTIWFKPTGWRPKDVMQKYPITFYGENVYEQVKYDTPATRLLLGWFWFQLAFHLLLEMYLFSRIAAFEYWDLLLYGFFVMLSIFSYTALMDRHKMAFITEIIKCVAGFGLMYRMSGWYLLDEWVQFGSVIMSAYLLLSLVVSFYYTYLEETNPSATLKTAS